MLIVTLQLVEHTLLGSRPPDVINLSSPVIMIRIQSPKIQYFHAHERAYSSVSAQHLNASLQDTEAFPGLSRSAASP